MEKFNRTLRGYDPDEVNRFLDKVINQVEQMVKEMKQKDQVISELRSLEQDNRTLREKISQYEHMEETLNKAILMAQRTSDQIKMSARDERDAIIDDAKKNASRIVNEALLKAEKTEQEANLLRRNINVFKRRVKDIVEQQLDVVNELDKVDL